MSGIDLNVQWRSAVVRENGEAYNFPNKFTLYFRERYSVPVIYRWRVMRKEGGEKEPIYIGEAEELPRRMQRIRTPSKKARASDTNKRLHDIFQKYLSAAREIVIDLADVKPFEIGGVRFGRNDLADRFKRRALENILLAQAQKSEGFEVLNAIVDPIDKAAQILKKLKPHQIREVIKLYGLAQQKKGPT
jgi:hypothetical protein